MATTLMGFGCLVESSLFTSTPYYTIIIRIHCLILWAIWQLYLQLIQGFKNCVCVGWEIFAIDILEFYLKIMCLVPLLSFIKIMILNLIVFQVASFTNKKQAIISYKKFVLKTYNLDVQEGLAFGFGLGMIILVVFYTYPIRGVAISLSFLNI